MEEEELSRIRDLMIKYSTARITTAEQQELNQWLENPEHRAAFERRTNEENILDAFKKLERGEQLQPAAFERLNKRLLVSRSTRQIWRLAVAAAVISVTATAIIFYQRRLDVEKLPSSKVQPLLAPGGYRAYVVLDDGSRLDLEKSGTGTIGAQGGTELIKQGEGRLDYKQGTSNEKRIMINTVVTPAGGQYHIVLSDGTGVWLNAASSIRFPTAFNGQDRHVRITGEAYFEVANDPAKPFMVDFGNSQIQVLGTRFNINFYQEFEKASATLMQGAVKVSSPAGATILQPGQQAEIGGTISVTPADTAQVMAWKVGYFEYKHADLRHVMADISRWYNLEVKYEGAVPDKQLSARISRMKNADDLLELLKMSGVNLKVENKTITVLP
ncbi:FecR family protein [Chitinophaga filiformis]|uniref:FecR domain-containing protein n=1 Tax=Chitinophaga filiformis TaxID=104663 RepID=A0ABY4HWV2_CHIFI|nr:FecR family protein [Chitinophaga filiformis]UPK68057.1 FecR domain-containing protein [Chitinophaga filiformis]